MHISAMVSARKQIAQIFLLLAMALAGSTANANTIIQNAAGLSSCSECHARDKEPTYDTLNALGLKYLSCKKNQACYDQLTAAVRLLQPGAAAPAARPQPAPAQAPAYVPPAAAQPSAAAGIPPGSYQKVCRNISLSVSGKVLYASCATRQNQTIYSRLIDFANCQSDIGDDDGYLVCNWRGGGSNKRERAINVNNGTWTDLTDVRLRTGPAATLVRYADIGLGKSITVGIDASIPCLVQGTYMYAKTAKSFTMNTCLHHKLLINGSGASFE